MIHRIRARLNARHTRKLIHNLVPTIAEQVVNYPAVENYILKRRYQALIARYATTLPTLSAADSLILKNIQTAGIHVTSLEALAIPGMAQFCDEGHQLFHTLIQQPLKRKRRFQMTPDFPLLLKHRYIFQWGLCDRLLAIATNYIQAPVAYDTCLCNLSINNGLETATRRWHLDNEDRKVLKVLIYFNDVDSEGGPFNYLPLDVTQQVLKVTKDRYKFLLTPELEALLPPSTPEPMVACTGSVGTVIFVDTAKLYHRGKPPTAKPRRAITFGYCSRRPRQPFRCGRNLLTETQLSQLEIGLSNEQKACVRWEKTLPKWIRKIPKYAYG